MAIYTNGVLAAQTVTDIRPFGPLQPDASPGIGIGNVNDGGNSFPFLGDIDELALFNRGLAADEVSAIYNLREPLLPAPHGVGKPGANFFIGQTYFPFGDAIEITSVERSENHMTVKGHYNLVSADEASLWLNITATNNDEVPNQAEAPQSMHISKGRGDFELSRSRLVPGLPHVSMYDNHHAFAGVYFGNQDEAAAEKSASWITNIFSASAETWSPTLAPGEQLDFASILSQAKGFMDQGNYDDALQRLIWYHNHSKFDPAQAGVRNSFALSNWVELGRHYPKARQALIEIRDADIREFSEGCGYFGLFLEVSSINRELQEPDATLALFRQVEAGDKKLAQQCFGIVEGLLAQQGEYEKCLEYLGDPQAAFERIHQSWQQMKQFEERSAARREQTKQFQEMIKTNPLYAHLPMLPAPPKFADNNFVGQARQLIEILVATGHQADVEKIQGEATAILDDPRLRSAVSDAEKKLQEKQLTLEASATAKYPGDWIWEPNSATLDRVPPIFLLRPSTIPTNWVPFDMFGKDRYLARGKMLKDLIATVWSQKNSEQKIVFETDLPAEKFDFIVTAEPNWWDKLEVEINQRFHLTQQIEGGVNGDTVVIKTTSTDKPAPAGSRNLPKLKDSL
jgi:hypothetical protein